MNMKETIRKILSEEGMDWTSDVKASLPDDRMLKKKFMVEMSLQDYLVSMYGYDFIDVILTDGRVIEFTIDGHDVKYVVYNSLTELVDEQGLSWRTGEDEVLTNDNFESFEKMVNNYLEEFTMSPVPKAIEDIMKKVIPLDIHGAYTGSL